MGRVVAAVIERDGKYLCMKRAHSRYSYISEHWEFPGGKVDEGENDYEALIREIKEEMDWDIYVGRQIAVINYEYPHFSCNLAAYLCKAGDTDDFQLLDHLDYKWLAPEELATLNWTAADRELLKYLSPQAYVAGSANT